MTDCSLIHDLLPFYADGAVSSESESIIREHLKSCPECRCYYSRISRIPHALEEREGRGHYRYSDVVRSLRREAIAQYTVGAALLLTSVACLVKTVSDSRKKDKRDR